MRKTWVLIGIVAVAMACASAALAVLSAPPFHRQTVFHAAPATENPYSFIAHGGGRYEGLDVTNSQEAVKSNLARGVRVIEIDLEAGADGELEGIYRAPDAHRARFTPIRARDLNKLMEADTGLVLVTDKVRDYKRVAAQLRPLERVYVEVPNVLHLIMARRAGIIHVMLRISSSWPLWLQRPLIHAMGVNMVTARFDKVSANKDFYRALKNDGICTQVFTVNDRTFVEQYADALCAVYSDVLLVH
jgi:glycerophosphoryl diester phosphodiesterase